MAIYVYKCFQMNQHVKSVYMLNTAVCSCSKKVSQVGHLPAKHYGSDNVDVTHCVVILYYDWLLLAHGFWTPHLSAGTACGQGEGPQL